MFQGLQRIIRAGSAMLMSILWSSVLLFVPIYLAGIAMLEGVTSFVSEEVQGQPDPEWRAGFAASTAFAGVESSGLLLTLYNYYGGCGRTASTLFRAVSGADWSPFAAAMSATSPIWAWVCSARLSPKGGTTQNGMYGGWGDGPQIDPRPIPARPFIDPGSSQIGPSRWLLRLKWLWWRHMGSGLRVSQGQNTAASGDRTSTGHAGGAHAGHALGAL